VASHARAAEEDLVTPFSRLALLVGTTLYAGGILAVGVYFGVAFAVGVFLFGMTLAVLATLELSPTPAAPDVTEGVAAEMPIIRRTREDIERAARASRDEE
jgi:hypothetical protein